MASSSRTASASPASVMVGSSFSVKRSTPSIKERIDATRKLQHACRVVVSFQPEKICFVLEVIPMDGSSDPEARRRLKFSEIRKDLAAFGAHEDQVDVLTSSFVRGEDCIIENLLISETVLDSFKRTAA
jgi:hypothetical protein